MSAGPMPRNAELRQSSCLENYAESMYSVCPDHESHVSSRLRPSPPPTPNPNSYNDTFSGSPPEWKLSSDLLDPRYDQEPLEVSFTEKVNSEKSSIESLLEKPNDVGNEDLGYVGTFGPSAVYQGQEEPSNICSAPYLAPLESGVFPSNRFDSFTSETSEDWPEHFIDPVTPSEPLPSTSRARRRPRSRPNGVSLSDMPSQFGLQGLGLTMNETCPVFTSESVDEITNGVNSVSVESSKPTRKAFGPVDQLQCYDSRSNYSKFSTKAITGTKKDSNLLSKTPAIYSSQYEERPFTPNRQNHDRNTLVPTPRPRTGVAAPRPSHGLPEVTPDHSLHVLKQKQSKVQSPSIHLR
ncbi:hypothetical protein MPSI1_000917 [Malassezia psittaci]|uniref:Uncharacterized protein n=1 Tax=Malassezia psittaci TaxID=1821823 RepID=A0AAF0F3J1_9BASI|nr:hypothetical protein MPSI1_000917 [Malassezia psittaci]